MSGIVQRQGLAERLIQWVGGAIERTFRPAEVGAGSAAHPAYDQETALSAYAAFPYVFAAVQAVCTDLSGLPLVARSGTNSGAPTTEDHPLIRLLRRPSGAMTGTRLRRQIVADFWLARNAYLLWTGTELHRLHPEHVTIKTDRNGIPVWYQHGTGGKTYRPGEVWHIADVSWSAQADCVYGEGPIRALAKDLQVEQAARMRANDQARRGRLDMLFSADSDMPLGPEAIRRLEAQYEQATTGGRGAFFVGSGIKATPLSITAREMDYLGLRAENRGAIAAALGVPPVRVGLPGANYGTARAELRQYWETLRNTAVLFDEVLTELGIAMGGDPSMRIVHDFTGVEILQVSYTERQHRATVWVHSMGADPAEAARYEGFANAPTGDVSDTVSARPADTSDPEPQETDRGLADRITVGMVARLRAVSDWSDLRKLIDRERLAVTLTLQGEGMPEAEADEVARDIAESVVVAAWHTVDDGGELRADGALCTIARSVLGA